MSVSTVSTYAVFQSTLSDVNKVESDLTNEQMQLSSGNASQTFAQMNGQTQQYMSLNDTIAKTTQYLNSHAPIEASVNTTSSILQQVISTANSLQGLVSQRMSGVATNAAFSTQVDGIWQQVVSQLNTSVAGQYLFSGTRTNTPPVNTQNFPTLQQPGVADSSYYNGNQQDLTVRIGYNVRADAPGFQKIFAGLALAKQGDAANSTSILQQAEDMVSAGLKDITSMQSKVAANASQLATSDANLTNSKLYWKGLQESIGNTDVVSVSTQVAVNQGILQAAFEAFSKITSLQLSNYLK
jgi:flagellar hook-associated protein 3 FlgL